MSTQGFTDFENNEDTKVGWYLAFTQEESESKRLTNLSYEATDMGGYDKPLEDFKVWYVTKLLKFYNDELKEIQKKNKDIAKKEYKVNAKDYQDWINSKIDENKKIELDNFEQQTEMNNIDKQYIDLGLHPERITKTYLLDNEEFKKVCKESKEYMSLSDKGK